ncbi:YrhB domain-containing protein [uncultured Pedobacter sp.]|uniref:YrhB domain-containing protein n=1 Tax=uncultured Pedobacter sp. TaxID=246139 RepID=UPI002600E0D2|nr:YrhB domain-containing protein [uncultured Pedobacter sp.]
MKQVDLVREELEAYLNKKYKYVDDSLIVLGDDTIDRDQYWVFFYVNRKYLETNDLSDIVVGNSPIIINKLTGEKYTTGTVYPVEYYMNEYENKLML